MRVSVVVPAFNNWSLTSACIETLRAVTASEILADIVVADDGSNDGVSAAWAAAQSTFTPILSERNRGFSAACNAGAAAGRGDVLFFLNNDAFVTAGSIATMLATLDASPTIGVVGARLFYADGTLQHAGLGLLDGPVSRWWHIHRQLPSSLSDAGIARDLLAVTGAALMIRRSLFDELHGFDAGYINGWEDVDLCLRAWCHGARVRYEPLAVIEHLESATLGRAHDDSANERRFIERWSAILAAAPRYPLAQIPPIALAVRDSSASTDRWARAHLKRWWGAHFGAKIGFIRPGSRVGRLGFEIEAALAKRRPTLEISLGEAVSAAPTGSIRVGFVAPLTAGDARQAVSTCIAHFWTPTAAGAALLIDVGVPAARVDVIGFGAGDARHETRRGGLVVAAWENALDLLPAFARHAPHVRTIELRAAAPPDFSAIDILLARNGGDRWGLLVPAALAHGCIVVTTPPLDAYIGAAPGVHVTDEAHLLSSLLELSVQPANVRTGSHAIHIAARRRLDARLAAQHAAATARALVHGIPSSALAAVDANLAAHLRCTAISPSAVPA